MHRERQFYELFTRLLGLSGAGDGRGARPTWLAGARAPATAGIHQQAEHGIGYGVERGDGSRELPEGES